MIGRRRLWLPLLLLPAALIRFGLAERQGLWADEIFSLALATGHSVEHPATAANAALGDLDPRLEVVQ